MVPIKISLKYICAALVASILLMTSSSADKIVLKDGSVETSERIWESERYIHFILNGTSDVEIRYAKDIVERIERQQAASTAPLEIKVAPVQGAGTAPAPAPAPAAQEKVPPPQTEPQVVPAPALVLNEETVATHQRLVQKNKGINFYDPRRKMRYWAMHNSKHKLLASALDSIAKQYDRTADWVEAHMGQENDLGLIHQNLSRQFNKEVLKIEPSQAAPVSATVEDRADARKDPVEAQHGQVTEEEAVPRAEKAEQAARQVPDTTHRATSGMPQAAPGIPFYDPRREEKYWSSQMTRHQTLEEALDALARQYDVTPAWIVTHMGETNDLSIIHRNIRNNLKQK